MLRMKIMIQPGAPEAKERVQGRKTERNTLIWSRGRRSKQEKDTSKDRERENDPNMTTVKMKYAVQSMSRIFLTCSFSSVAPHLRSAF